MAHSCWSRSGSCSETAASLASSQPQSALLRRRTQQRRDRWSAPHRSVGRGAAAVEARPAPRVLAAAAGRGGAGEGASVAAASGSSGAAREAVEALQVGDAREEARKEAAPQQRELGGARDADERAQRADRRVDVCCRALRLALHQHRNEVDQTLREHCTGRCETREGSGAVSITPGCRRRKSARSAVAAADVGATRSVIVTAIAIAVAARHAGAGAQARWPLSGRKRLSEGRGRER